MIYGMKCGYYGGDPLKMLQFDLPILKPTFFPSVPRIYNRLYSKINATFAEAKGIKGSLIKSAVAAKMAGLKSSGKVTHCLWDKIVFKKTKALLGGNVRYMLTGSAPISQEVLEFMKICFCVPMFEGYGMTETCAGSVLTVADDPLSGHVGGPVANVKIRLRDIPEMGYLHTNDPPQGEVCFWGPSIMTGYFKNPEKTAESCINGWLHSGDVGQVNPNGSIKIIDRAKNIFKLSQGEYLAPEKLENVYVQSSYIGQAWIYGDSLRDFALLFAVVDPDKAKAFAEENGLTFNDDLMSNEKLKSAVMEDVIKLANENKFNSLEKPKQIMLVKDPWTIEEDMLTPTMKLKRNIAKKKYLEDIERMYNEGPRK